MVRDQLVYYVSRNILDGGCKVYDNDEKHLFNVQHSCELMDADCMLFDTYDNKVAEVRDRSGWLRFQLEIYRNSKRVAKLEQEGFSLLRSFVLTEQSKRSKLLILNGSLGCCGDMALVMQRQGRRIGSLMELVDSWCSSCALSTFALRILDDHEDAITLLCGCHYLVVRYNRNLSCSRAPKNVVFGQPISCSSSNR